MSVAKVIEVSSTSTTSFEDAINQGIGRACDTIDNVRGGCASIPGPWLLALLLVLWRPRCSTRA